MRSRNIHEIALVDLFQIALKDTHVIEGFVAIFGIASGRFGARQFGKCAAGHKPQLFQRDVSFFRALHELFGDVLSARMVAAVWQTSADFLKHDVHIRGCPFFDFGHFDTKVGYRCQSIGVNLSRRRSISSRRVSAYCLVASPMKR